LVPAGSKAPAPALKAIESAEAIILGPGSLYTSVIPNLLVAELAEALQRSKAPKIYICNVMTQPGETDGYGAADHLRAILAHVDFKLDFAVVNVGRPGRLAEKYRQEGSQLVEAQLGRFQELGVEVVPADLVDETDWVRHDPQKLARIVSELIARFRSRS